VYFRYDIIRFGRLHESIGFTIVGKSSSKTPPPIEIAHLSKGDRSALALPFFSQN
jgi:hypothetical protein